MRGPTFARRSASSLPLHCDLSCLVGDRTAQPRLWRAHTAALSRFDPHRPPRPARGLVRSHGPSTGRPAQRQRCVSGRRARTLVRDPCRPRSRLGHRQSRPVGSLDPEPDAARVQDAADARSRPQTMSWSHRPSRSVRASRTSSRGSRRSSERATTTRRAPCSRRAASGSPSTFACATSRAATSPITGATGRVWERLG